MDIVSIGKKFTTLAYLPWLQPMLKKIYKKLVHSIDLYFRIDNIMRDKKIPICTKLCNERKFSNGADKASSVRLFGV